MEEDKLMPDKIGEAPWSKETKPMPDAVARALSRKPSERTEIDHLCLIKHIYNGSVRNYLLSMGAFKDEK